MAAQDIKGEPLQLIQLDVDAGKVQVNEDALGRLEKNLKALGTKQVAVISVMGAFRTGKSFLLDLFLRYLRFEEKLRLKGQEIPDFQPPERGSGEDFPLPDWITSAGTTIEGATDEDCGGFRFKGGMDACTEGIWVWSQPFLRKVAGKEVALVLMDTQGAWDSNMTKEQSATIFGLTAVLSSKQIYNVQQQIQEDKVENLAYFMRFAQAALHRAMEDMKEAGASIPQDEVDMPFQSLDFLVRDWRHYRDDMTIEQCKEQMATHLGRHLDPKRVRENSTAEAMQAMFKRINCWCLPHPGLAIEKETWSGAYNDIDKDFLRMMDSYCRQVFTEGLAPKSILGSDMSTITFPLVLKNFVNAFENAAPVAMTFTQAMTNCTVLLAKEQAMKLYQKKMDEEVSKHPSGLDPQKFEELDANVLKSVKDEYQRVTIFGSEDTRGETWEAITDNLKRLHEQYAKDNNARLQKALVGFANLAMLGLGLFILDRVSDFTCDWWSQTCHDMSKVMFTAYVGILAYIGFYVYRLMSAQGKMAVGLASAELWKEIVRLLFVYGDLVQQVNWMEIPKIVKQVASGVSLQKALQDARPGAAKQESKKDK